MFVDDPNVFASDQLISIVNTELIKVVNWLKINKLSLNVIKHILFFSIPDKKNIQNIDNNQIKKFKSTKFLGVIINENLTWTSTSLSAKLVRALVSSAD